MGESNFVLKVEAACQKKEELYTASKAQTRRKIIAYYGLYHRTGSRNDRLSQQRIFL